jgi:hypothetical protein
MTAANYKPSGRDKGVKTFVHTNIHSDQDWTVVGSVKREAERLYALATEHGITTTLGSVAQATSVEVRQRGYKTYADMRLNGRKYHRRTARRSAHMAREHKVNGHKTNGHAVPKSFGRWQEPDRAQVIPTSKVKLVRDELKQLTLIGARQRLHEVEREAERLRIVIAGLEK